MRHKIQIPLTLLILIIAISGCNKDEDEYPTRIVGKWNFIKTESANTRASGTIHTTFDHPDDRWFDFQEGGSLQIKNHETIVNTNTWRVEGDKLFITGSNTLGLLSDELIIKKLSATELTLKYIGETDGWDFDITYYLNK